MSLTPEQLLQPRFKVVANYPNSPYRVGKIITCTDNALIDFYEEYKNIFVKLQWWQDRELPYMPEYVRNVFNDKVARVKKGITHLSRKKRWNYLNMAMNLATDTFDTYSPLLNKNI